MINLNNLSDLGFATKEQIDLLQNHVNKKSNILVVGTAGRGKTTLINALVNSIPAEEKRILVISQYNEMVLRNNVIYKFHEDKEKSLISHTVKEFAEHTYNVNNYRLVFDELRQNEEGKAFVQGMLNGNKGFIAGIHGNYVYAGLLNLASLCCPEEKVSYDGQNQILDAYKNVLDVVVTVGFVNETSKSNTASTSVRKRKILKITEF